MCKSYFLTIFVLWVVLKYQYFIAFCTKNLFFTDFIRFFKGHNSLKKLRFWSIFFSKCPERAKQVFMFFDHIQFVNCWWEIYEKLKSWRPSWNFWRIFWIFFGGQTLFFKSIDNKEHLCQVACWYHNLKYFLTTQAHYN